jgi:hypothetical protein
VNFRPHPAVVVGLVLALCAAAVAGFAILRARRAATASEMASYLPAEEGVILAIDFAGLRQSGALAAVGGRRVAQEPDYQSFVQETGFDYQQDLDYAVAWFGNKTFCALLKGRFDWPKLKAYVARQSGTCRNSFCRLEGSTLERRISFFPVRSGVLALAVGPDEWAAAQLMTAKPSRRGMNIPNRPVWLLVPGGALREAERLPAGLRLFAMAMEGAEKVSLSLATSEGRMAVELDASCRSPKDASLLAYQLDGITGRLKEMIARENKSPNPGDLSGVLTAGVFNVIDQRVLGRWPVNPEFLQSIVGDSQ